MLGPERRQKLAQDQITGFGGGQTFSLVTGSLPIVIGLAAITFPTLQYITTQNWATEQGSHSPLVLAAGLWLLVRLLPQTKPVQLRPSGPVAFAAVSAAALALVIFRTAAVIELEVYALYSLCLAVLFAFIGWRALVMLWFPLFFLTFAVPLPDSLVSAVTNPLKLWISEAAVAVLYALGYPIASSGVTIQIGQYELLVAAACAGLNSIITLTALTLFYVYLTHRDSWRYMTLLTLMAVPVAIFSNLIRVLILVLLTYYAGEATAQGFLHYFAGMTTFAVALMTIYLIDIAVTRTARVAIPTAATA